MVLYESVRNFVNTLAFLFLSCIVLINKQMPLHSIISIIQIFISIVLMICVLLQQRGSSLGSSFGGGGASYHTRRGFEKILFNSTILFGVLFVATTIAALIIK